MSDRQRPTYATRLLEPFAEILEDEAEFAELMEQMFEAVGDRVLVEVAHRGLVLAVEKTKDADLGLRAARRLVLGDAGTVDYVVSSAPSVREALEQAGRYMRLVNDILDVRLEFEGPTAIVRLDNSVILPRAAADFEVGGFFRNHMCEWFHDRLADVTVLFMHQAPSALAEYERTFAPALVRFGAPMLGFRFDRSFLDLPLKGADANLQRVMVPYADQTLGQLALAKSVTMDVRRMISARLGSGAPDIADVASELGMSMRTLGRRLESEGTTFRALTDDVRRQMALEYVGGRDTDFSEISRLLGFSHAAAFHRAFRRWTAQTPLGYRRAAGR